MLSYRSTADHQAALQALTDLQRRGVALTRHAYNAAMRVCADAGAVDEALRLLEMLRSAAADERRRLQPGGLEGREPGGGQQPGRQAGEQHLGQQQVHGQQQRSGALHTDCRSYSAALAAVAAAGKWNRAAQLHRWMEEDGVAPDAPLATQLLSAYAAGGQAGAAQGVFDGLAAGGSGPGVLLGFLPAAGATSCRAHMEATGMAGCAQGTAWVLAAAAPANSHAFLTAVAPSWP